MDNYNNNYSLCLGYGVIVDAEDVVYKNDEMRVFGFSLPINEAEENSQYFVGALISETIDLSKCSCHIISVEYIAQIKRFYGNIAKENIRVCLNNENIEPNVVVFIRNCVSEKMSFPCMRKS